MTILIFILTIGLSGCYGSEVIEETLEIQGVEITKKAQLKLDSLDFFMLEGIMVLGK